MRGIRRAGREEAEDQAVPLVERLRGRVARGDTAPDKPVVKVQRLTGELTDADLKDMAALKTLTALTLDSSHKLTNAGAKELAARTGLTSASGRWNATCRPASGAGW